MNKLEKSREEFRKAYFEKLKDPRWQKRRLEVMGRDGFSCQICCSDTDTLNVHHLCYRPGADPWDYPDHQLVTLCEECHKREKSAWDGMSKTLADTAKSCGLFAHEAEDAMTRICELIMNSVGTHARDYVISAIYYKLECIRPQAALEEYAQHLKTMREYENRGMENGNV